MKRSLFLVSPRLFCQGLLLALLAGVLSAQHSATLPNVPLASSPAAVTANVRNAPLSADVVTDYDRVLEYGGQIHREMWGKVFRDSQGRVRTETDQTDRKSGTGQAECITIQDPIQHAVIHLDPRTRTATITRTGSAIANKDASGAAAGKSAQAVSSPQMGAAPNAVTGPIPPATAPKATVVRTEALGTKSFGGVMAIGTKTTRIYDVGVMDNGQSVVTVTESWYSHDLDIVVSSETDDGQSGHNRMRLTNIVRSEPDPRLFQIPQDYAVKETSVSTASLKH